ncbi:MAG: hypothetical protein MJ225_04190 [Bacilli bacterium]|nr:hypothetical protein [Bacilli bacterium]
MKKIKFLGLICGLLLMPSFISLVSSSNNSNISEASAAISSWDGPQTFDFNEEYNEIKIENITIQNKTLNASAFTFNIKANSHKTIIRFENVTFMDITSSSYGSCVRLNADKNVYTTEIYFNNCNFINCSTTSGYGGAIYASGADGDSDVMTFNNCFVDSCSSTKYGGFLYSYDSKISYVGSYTFIRNCQSSSDGGAMYIQYGRSVSGFTFINNRSQASGGAIISDVSNLNINNCNFYENAVYDYGGAIYIKHGCNKNTIQNCLFYNNKQNKYEELKYEIYDYECATKKYLTFLCDSNCSIKDHIYYGEKNVDYCNHCLFSDLSLSKESDEKYHISNQLDWLKFYSDVQLNNKNFDNETVVLEDNIVAYGMVGSYPQRKSFKGTFDGNNFAIYIAQSSYTYGQEYYGLFGYLQNATIKNLKLGPSNIRVGNNSGALAGKVVNSKIDRVKNYTNITASDGNYIGGICGMLDENSTIINSYNYGIVKAQNKSGGLVGQLNDTCTIYNCINHGSISAENGTVGSIAGYCTSLDGVFSCRIFNCYCTDGGTEFAGYGAQKNTKNCYFSNFASQSEILDYLNEGIIDPLQVFGTNVNVDEWLFWLIEDNEFQFGERYIDVGFDDVYKTSTYAYKRVPLDTNYSISDTLTTGWYFVKTDVTIDGHLIIKGDVKLIIKTNVTLTVNDGVYVREGNTFSLYTTDAGGKQGTLITSGSTVDYAGIGSKDREKAGTINICGCYVEAKGAEHAAGIGTGYAGLGGNLNIYDGRIKATAGKLSAGIGGGMVGKGIITTIYNGHVEAYGAPDDDNNPYDELGNPREIHLPGCGIGAGGYGVNGQQQTGAITTVYNGYVYAESKTNKVKAIQDPLTVCHCNHIYNSQSNSTIEIIATSEVETHVLKEKHELVRPKFNDNNELVSYGIKPYYECECGRCYESYNDGVLSNMITTSIDYWKEHEGRIGNIPIEIKITDGPNTKIINWNAYREFPFEDYLLPALVHDSVFLRWEYKDGNDWYKFNQDNFIANSMQINAKRMSKEEIHNAAKTDITSVTDGKIGPGVYTINTTNRTDIYSRLEVNDWAVIALPDDCDLRLINGIYVPLNTTLAIIDDGVKGNGRLQASNNDIKYTLAAIDNGSGGIITIYGGIVNANGNYWAAAIGGGNNHRNGPIIIYGGTITANSMSMGAGIGSGPSGRGGKIIIYGGNIYAYAKRSNGIGRGNTDWGAYGLADIKIYGGVIHANSETRAAIEGNLTLPENIKMYDSGGSLITPPARNMDVYVRPTPVESIPTCSQPGHRAYYYNSVYYYLDPECTKIIGDGSLEALYAWKNQGGEGYLDPVDHKYVISYSWSEDFTTCTAIKECTYGCGVGRVEEVAISYFDELTNSFVAEFTNTCFETQTFKMSDDVMALIDWIDNYLYMDEDPHGEGRTCQQNYINAKTNLMKLSTESILIFVNPEYDSHFLNARLRYEAWARANGDNDPYNAEVTGIQFLSGNNYLPFENLSNSIIIIFTSMITLGTFMFVFTKKKENK